MLICGFAGGIVLVRDSQAAVREDGWCVTAVERGEGIVPVRDVEEAFVGQIGERVVVGQHGRVGVVSFVVVAVPSPTPHR